MAPGKGQGEGSGSQEPRECWYSPGLPTLGSFRPNIALAQKPISICYGIIVWFHV